MPITVNEEPVKRRSSQGTAGGLCPNLDKWVKMREFGLRKETVWIMRCIKLNYGPKESEELVL